MYQRVLVAIDGSPTSQLALLEAARLAPAHARVCVLTVISPPAGADRPEQAASDSEQLRSHAFKTSKDILERARQLLLHQGIEAQLQLLESTIAGDGRIADLLIETATRWPADVLVLGSHGQRGRQPILMGRLTETLIRRSPVPLLVVPAGPG